MTLQQITVCVNKLETFLNIEHAEHIDITDRIFEISCSVHDDPLERNIIDWLLDRNYNNTGAYQQCIYHMMKFIKFTDTEMDEYIKILFGENDEPIDCIFTDELYDHIYNIMANEHIDHWQAGYFELEDLDDTELGRHNKYIEYIKNKEGDESYGEVGVAKLGEHIQIDLNI